MSHEVLHFIVSFSMLLLLRVILINENRKDLDEQMFYRHFTKVYVQTVVKHDRHYYGSIQYT